MKIGVLGAGALGSVIGGTLAQAGEDVWLVTRSQAHVAAVRAAGLRLIGSEGESAVSRIHAATDSNDCLLYTSPSPRDS